MCRAGGGWGGVHWIFFWEPFFVRISIVRRIKQLLNDKRFIWSSDWEHRKMKLLTCLSSRIRKSSIKRMLLWPLVSQQTYTLELGRRAELVWQGMGNDTPHQPWWLLPNALISAAKDSNHWRQQLWVLDFKTCDLVSIYWQSHWQATGRLAEAMSHLSLFSLLACLSMCCNTGKVHWNKHPLTLWAHCKDFLSERSIIYSVVLDWKKSITNFITDFILNHVCWGAHAHTTVFSEVRGQPANLQESVSHWTEWRRLNSGCQT